MDLSQILNSSVIEQLSKVADADTDKVSSLVGAAIPTLVQAMANNAQNEEGAQALFGALTDHAKSDVTTDIDKVDDKDGAKILKHILGDGLSDTVKSLAGSSGLKQKQTKSILSNLAPLLMNVIGGEKEETNTDANGLSGLLGSLLGTSENNSLTSSIIGVLAGSLLSGMLGGGSSNSSSSNSSSGGLLSGLLGDLLN